MLFRLHHHVYITMVDPQCDRLLVPGLAPASRMARRRRILTVSDPGLRTILADLRKRVISGGLKAGERLPSVRELAATHGVAATTVQRCMQELATAGFISTHGRNGTRVVDHPPHRHCFGLVLPELPDLKGRYHERHWQAKAQAAQALSQQSNQSHRRVEIFHGINGHPELPEHVRLLAALDERRLAGLIIVDEGRLHDWLVPERLGLPVVGVVCVPGRPAIGDLRLDLAHFLSQALAAVAQCGRRRPAVLLNVFALSCVSAMRSRAAALGLDMPLHHLQCLPTNAPGWAAQVIAGLFRGPVRQRPDAVIIADEGVIPAVEDALDAQGVGAVFQVHMANMPLPTLARRPALRLGWDHRQYLLTAMSMIDAWHTHRRPIGDHRLPMADIGG